jgi:hypothetical protein
MAILSRRPRGRGSSVSLRLTGTGANANRWIDAVNHNAGKIRRK